MSEPIDIRVAGAADLPALATFFRSAYGEATVFQDHAFLRWYFARPGAEGMESLIAVLRDGTVIGHYGGLASTLQLAGRPVSLVWGANAFTLPAWRGSGAGRRLVERMTERYDVFGVIGFSPKTAEFYAQAGFNVFGRERFTRHTLALSEGVWELARQAGGHEDAVRARLPGPPAQLPLGRGSSISRDEAGTLSWPPPGPVEATVLRDAAYLRRRFFEHPYISYRCLAAVENGRVRAALFTRREQPQPAGPAVERIVDLFGEATALPEILRAAAARASAEGAALIDCATFGGAFDAALAEAGYTPLAGDEAALLPQVFAPIEPRPNHEYLGLFSRRCASEIARLRHVHFTRADSDRDRIARLSQLAAL